MDDSRNHKFACKEWVECPNAPKKLKQCLGIVCRTCILDMTKIVQKKEEEQKKEVEKKKEAENKVSKKKAKNLVNKKTTRSD